MVIAVIPFLTIKQLLKGAGCGRREYARHGRGCVGLRAGIRCRLRAAGYARQRIGVLRCSAGMGATLRMTGNARRLGREGYAVRRRISLSEPQRIFYPNKKSVRIVRFFYY